LSKLATHSVGMPSSTPSRISLGMSRMVLVTGAASTLCRTGIAAVLVITRKGRRPTSSISPHQISPRFGSAPGLLGDGIAKRGNGRCGLGVCGGRALVALHDRAIILAPSIELDESLDAGAHRGGTSRVNTAVDEVVEELELFGREAHGDLLGCHGAEHTDSGC
jgi:hypothetical protein